jgi:transcriptional regulator with XRE-family HTH domain
MKIKEGYTQHKVTIVFVHIIKLFIKYGIIKSKTELCESLGYNKGTLSDILNGKRNVTLEFMYLFINKYQIDANIIFGDFEEDVLRLKIKEIAKDLINKM